jgi:hypothetical protein
MIDDLGLARAVHVLALVHWIGGVGAHGPRRCDGHHD